MGKTEQGRLCAGVDLHKTQFTVCAANEDGELLQEAVYPASPDGYDMFIGEMHHKGRGRALHRAGGRINRQCGIL